MRHRAFTIIELMVTLGIIGVLISILVPALSGARRVSTSLACGTQLRSMATAMIQYADAHNAVPVSSNFIGISTRTGNPPPPDRTRLELPEALLPYLDAELPRLLDDGSITDHAPWTCPAQRRYTGLNALGHRFIPDGFSYGYALSGLVRDAYITRPYDIPDEPGLGRTALQHFTADPRRIILFDEVPFHLDEPDQAQRADGRNSVRFDGSVVSN
ncbi:MAG: hypothetical protein COB69_10570 [Phycisphaera sp.]|nr:MAG: hypothetical protein COB69_10570 [Phycisphaera sp.]